MIPQHGTVELSRSRLRHNLTLLKQHAGNSRICATVKANAYGHGVADLLPVLEAEGVEWLAVYSIDEAMALAASAFKILVLAPTVVTPENGFISTLREIFARNIRLNVTDAQSALRISMLADHILWRGGRLPIHIQVDTGLTRMGAAPAEIPELAQDISTFPALTLEGLFTHLSHGDTPGHPSLQHQLETFRQIASPIKARLPGLLLHVQNSGGLINLAMADLDLVRIGIALYGLQPSTDHPVPGLLPIARVTAPILALHDRPAGTGVGYGHTFITRRDSRLAIVPFGYADGYPRQLSNSKNAIAQIRGISVPVVGRVSMDQIILDVTDLAGIAPGEQVTVISNNPTDPNSLDAMATSIGTIGYELATHLGNRLNRVLVD